MINDTFNSIEFYQNALIEYTHDESEEAAQKFQELLKLLDEEQAKIDKRIESKNCYNRKADKLCYF